MTIQHINPEGVSAPTNYSHVVIAQGQRLVFIAGQTAVDPQGQIVGEGDLAAQAKQVFENLKTCLAAAGATFNDVVKTTTFIVNYKVADRATLAAVRADYLPADGPPASTLVGVQALARPEFRIEIEAVAVVS